MTDTQIDAQAVGRIAESALPPAVRRIVDAVQKGNTALIERAGQPRAAIVDIVDYRILRAVARFQSDPPVVDDPAVGLPD